MDTYSLLIKKVIGKELKQVDELINRSVKNIGDKEVESHLLKLVSKGKKMRPTITILFANIFGNSNENTLKLAAAIEIIHDATLLHDDVIDKSNLRRGYDTLNKRFSNSTAVYSGDILLSEALSLINSTNINKANSIAIKYLNRILKGELSQKRNRNNFNITEENYIEQISNKTSSLFILSGLLGVYSVNNNPDKEEINKITNILDNIGIAFQLIDDLLDFKDEKIVNKNSINDLKNGIFNFPILLSIKDNKGKIVDLIEDEQFENINEYIYNNGYLSKTKEIAKKYILESKNTIDTLKDGQSKKLLSSIMEQTINRIY